MNNFKIKMTAAVLMLIDHIYHIIGTNMDVPILFTWLGRLSAPLFFFMTAEGMYHTKNPKRMMIRLYIASVCMGVFNLIYNGLRPEYGYVVRNNIFQTLFLVAVYIYLLQLHKATVDKVTKRKIKLWMVMPLVVNIFVLIVDGITSISLTTFIQPFVPLPITVEGSFIFVILGVGMYAFRDRRLAFNLFYIGFSSIFFILPLTNGFTIDNLFFHSFQWMMVLSLPIMWLYNDEKGKSLKYFFYVFYPAHIYILVLIQLLTYKGS